MYLKIGSGDITKLLSGTHTKGFGQLFQKFVSDFAPNYNSFASPIDALRTGAILEGRYLSTLDDSYFVQFKAKCKKYDCAVSSIDFAKMKDGKMIDFDELKTIYFTDFIDVIVPLSDMDEKERINFIKRKFKSNYNQVQFQLFCSGLKEANLVFLSVESYDDDENNFRKIKDRDFRKFRIKRDETVIKKIIERIQHFQNIKDLVTK